MNEPETKQQKPAKRGPVDGIVRERKWPFFLLTTGWVAVVFGAVSFAIVPAILGMLQAFGISFAAFNTDVVLTFASAIVYVLVLAIILGGPRILRLWSSRISYRRLLGMTHLLRWRDILFALIGFVIYLALSLGFIMLVTKLIPGFDASQTQDTGFSKVLSANNTILVFLALVVIAPVAEEVIFRGYLFGTLRRSLPVWAAALVTSIIFGVVHGQWNVGLDVFVMSLVSCFLRYRTGALWASILLHMFKNGLAFYLLYIYPVHFS